MGRAVTAIGRNASSSGSVCAFVVVSVGIVFVDQLSRGIRRFRFLGKECCVAASDVNGGGKSFSLGVLCDPFVGEGGGGFVLRKLAVHSFPRVCGM